MRRSRLVPTYQRFFSTPMHSEEPPWKEKCQMIVSSWIRPEKVIRGNFEFESTDLLPPRRKYDTVSGRQSLWSIPRVGPEKLRPTVERHVLS